jgi:hypothetical protein
MPDGNVIFEKRICIVYVQLSLSFLFSLSFLHTLELTGPQGSTLVMLSFCKVNCVFEQANAGPTYRYGKVYNRLKDRSRKKKIGKPLDSEE